MTKAVCKLFHGQLLYRSTTNMSANLARRPSRAKNGASCNKPTDPGWDVEEIPRRSRESKMNHRVSCPFYLQIHLPMEPDKKNTGFQNVVYSLELRYLIPSRYRYVPDTNYSSNQQQGDVRCVRKAEQSWKSHSCLICRYVHHSGRYDSWYYLWKCMYFSFLRVKETKHFVSH